MDEKLISVSHLTVRQSISILLTRIAIIENLFALLFFAALYLYGQSLLTSYLYLLIPFALKMIVTIVTFYQWMNEYYEIWQDKVVHRKGFIFQKEHEWTLGNIVQLRLDQNFIGRLLNFGTIYLYDKDLRKEYYMYDIHNPHKYLSALQHILPQADLTLHQFAEKREEHTL